jgi:15-cis-phytoene desaturase
LADLITDFEAIFDSHSGLVPGEARFFAERIWQILSSCQDRRLAQYEQITWWDYLKADDHSEAYRNLLVDGLSRSLLANDPRHASVRTVGDTNVQLLLGMFEPAHPVDRLLDGPTTKVWLEPWRRHLLTLGVDFHMEETVERFGILDGAVTGVQVRGPAGVQEVTGDAYVFALPVERMSKLLLQSAGGPDDPLRADPALPGVVIVSSNVRWMNGVQFFLIEDVPITKGHVLYADSPWSVTSISEAQFWSDEHLPQCGDGRVNGVLSACISCWNAPGILYGLPALDCTPDQIVEEVWAQICRSVNVGGRVLLDRANRQSAFLDPDLVDHLTGKVHLTDAEPLFVNFIDSWKSRPEAVLQTANMVLASDYVRTYTDVACMEAANEAARRAVNRLLELFGSTAPPCQLWQLHEPDIFAPFRWHDKSRFEQALPWDGGI